MANRKVVKKAKARNGNLATIGGRVVDLTPVEFEEVEDPSEEFDFRNRGIRASSKYAGVVNRALEMEVGTALKVPVGDDEDARLKRQNVAQVIYNKVAQVRSDAKFRVRLDQTETKIGILCLEKDEEEEEVEA